MNLDFNELINNNQEPEFDFKKVYDSCFIDLSEEMPLPETLISIGEHGYKGRMYPTSVMTAGEFSAITAASKSKKTFLKSAFAAAYIGGDTVNLFPNIRGHRDRDYTIIDADTEQGKFYTQRTMRRPHEMAGSMYDNYVPLCMRHLPTKDRLKLLDEMLKNQESLYKEPVKLMFIDGIADLVENTNDIVMSGEAADYLLKWTYIYNVHISTVIHKSPFTGKPLGHLGTYVLKKAESVIDLNKDDEGYIKVTNPYSRGYSFEEFRFDVNGEALPYLIEDIF